MSKNELVVGQPRLGWFVDGDPATDHVAVMLRDTGTAIELTIPLRGMFADDDPYARWWSAHMKFGDDPERTKHSYAPPRVLLVQDVDGSVVLVGCRATGSSSSFAVGRGHVIANYAVLGGEDLQYEHIDGLRTELPALAAWTRLSSMTVKVGRDSENRVSSVQMNLSSVDPTPLARALNLEMHSEWRTERPDGGFVAYEGVELQTAVQRPRTWEEHLGVHRAVLDLVSVAAWQPFGFASMKVRDRSGVVRNAAGRSPGRRWLTVATHRLPKHQGWTKTPHFLFPYDEIGPSGIKRWLQLRKTYGRVVGSLMTILRSDNQWGHPSIVQSGIALESLAYLIDTEKNGGAHLDGRGQMGFNKGLRVILDDMGVKPVSDEDDWIKRANASYMGAKHPDRPEPDSQVQLNTLRENLLVIRFWIALQLGATPDSLKSRIASDPLGREVVLVR